MEFIRIFIILLLPKRLFHTPRSLESLDLSENEITVVEAGSFSGIRHLKYLGKNRSQPNKI